MPRPKGSKNKSTIEKEKTINNEMPTSIPELEAMLEAKKAESAEAFASGNYARMAELGQELTTIQANLESARKATSSDSGISAAQLQNIVSQAVKQALSEAMTNQNELISQIKDLTSVMKSQNDEIAALKAEIAALKAAHNNNLDNLENQRDKNNLTNEQKNNEPTNNIAPAPETKERRKGATTKLKEEQERIKKEFKGDIAQEYNDMVVRQEKSPASAIRDFVNRYPDFNSMPEWLQEEVLKASENDNDVYHVIAQNMDIWEEETRQRAMEGATESPTDEQISHIDESSVDAETVNININDFETILDDAFN